ncbi:MAG: hypothetical protein QM831_29320 [Kofleriaceae bacterium]
MRTTIAMLLVGLTASACTKGGSSGEEEAKREAEAERKAKEATPGAVAKKINPPVPGRAKLKCENMIDADKFTQALGETAPLTLKESNTEAEAAASCSLIRGGKRPSEAEQKAMLKKSSRLGVLPGDEVCNVSAFCWTIEDQDRFVKKCQEMKEKIDETLGFKSCILVVATGEDDVNRHRFFDDDTKCIFQVRGGPSMVDNDVIGKCAKAAHDLIGPAQIAVTADATAPAPAAGSAK